MVKYCATAPPRLQRTSLHPDTRRANISTEHSLTNTALSRATGVRQAKNKPSGNTGEDDCSMQLLSQGYGEEQPCLLQVNYRQKEGIHLFESRKYLRFASQKLLTVFLRKY